MEVLDKVRTKKKAINQMLKIIGDKMKNKGITEAVVYHILNKSEAIDLKKRLKLELKNRCKKEWILGQ